MRPPDRGLSDRHLLGPRRSGTKLKPPLAEKVIGGKRLPQWQHELSSSGRVFYCPGSDG